MYVYIYIYSCYVHICMRVYISSCANVYIHICMYTSSAKVQIGYICMLIYMYISLCIHAYIPIHIYVCIFFFDGYCCTVQGLLDWFEVDLGFTELSFIQIDLCVLCVFVLYSRVSLSSCPFWTFCTASPARWECL